MATVVTVKRQYRHSSSQIRDNQLKIGACMLDMMFEPLAARTNVVGLISIGIPFKTKTHFTEFLIYGLKALNAASS